MHIYELRRQIEIPRTLGETFRFFENPHNLALITPAWLNLVVASNEEVVMHKGAEIDYTIRWLGVSMKWKTFISDYEPPFRFVDIQVTGPYRLWEHTHGFHPTENGTLVADTVRYALPYGLLGRLVHRLIVRRQVEGIFAYRQKALLKVFGCSPARAPSAT